QCAPGSGDRLARACGLLPAGRPKLHLAQELEPRSGGRSRPRSRRERLRRDSVCEDRLDAVLHVSRLFIANPPLASGSRLSGATACASAIGSGATARAREFPATLSAKRAGIPPAEWFRHLWLPKQRQRTGETDWPFWFPFALPS